MFWELQYVGGKDSGELTRQDKLITPLIQFLVSGQKNCYRPQGYCYCYLPQILFLLLLFATRSVIVIEIVIFHKVCYCYCYLPQGLLLLLLLLLLSAARSAAMTNFDLVALHCNNGAQTKESEINGRTSNNWEENNGEERR